MKTMKSTKPRTTETKIGGVTYIVTAHFNKDGQTAERIISRLISDRVSSEINNIQAAPIP